jgi:hypothetical protein
MRRLVFLGCAAVALGVCVAGSAGTVATTSLKVTYWEDGARPADRVTWTLRCNPAGGTLARPAVACRKLALGGSRMFAPLPRDIVCTEIYGGPQVARVVGLVRGKRVWATFSRTNGCHISRWNSVSPWLLPRGGAMS